MTLTITVLMAGQRVERRGLSPDGAIAVALAIRENIEVLRMAGFAVLLRGDDGVIHIAHREAARGCLQL